MTPERKVKNVVVSVLKEHDAYYFFPVTSGYGASGVPDIVGCINGKFFAIECKAGKGKTTALQDKHIAQITAVGGSAIVINEGNLMEVHQLMKTLKG